MLGMFSSHLTVSDPDIIHSEQEIMKQLGLRYPRNLLKGLAAICQTFNLYWQNLAQVRSINERVQVPLRGFASDAGVGRGGRGEDINAVRLLSTLWWPLCAMEEPSSVDRYIRCAAVAVYKTQPSVQDGHQTISIHNL